jgi:hypothetical protein
MKLSSIILAVFIVIAAACFSEAQTQQSQTPQSHVAQPQHEWTPQGIDALRQSASSKTEFTLDHSMLVFASKLDPDNDDLRRVIAGVNAVSVRNFRYSGRSSYDPESLGSVKEEYRTAGWKQLMNNHAKDGGPGVTDLWVRMENNAVSNVAVLQAKASEVTFVLVSGSISPLDLFRLGGHFGIPKMDGGVVIPNTHP